MSSATITLYDRLGGRPSLLRLLHHFYADIRQHQVTGPVFAAHVHDWPAHIEKIANFWSNVTGGPTLYSGPMPFKHLPLGLAEHHFQAWLGLWGRHCHTWLAPQEADELTAAAETIGRRLRQVVALHSPAPFAVTE